MSKNNKRPDCGVQVDARPFEENETSTKSTNDSNSNGEFKYSTTFTPEVGSTGMPCATVTFGNARGPINIGNTYITTVTNSKNVSLQSTVVYDSSSDDDSGTSESFEDSEPEPEVKEEILKSSLLVSTDNKELVSENIGNNYRRMARHLKGANFTTVEINSIMSSNTAFRTEEGVYQILERWYEKAPKHATVGNLAAALQRINRIDLANKLSLDDLTDDLADELGKL